MTVHILEQEALNLGDIENQQALLNAIKRHK